MVRIIKVPGINGLNKTKGCEKASNFIFESIKKIYSNEKGSIIDSENLEVQEMSLELGDIDKMNEQISSESSKLFENYSEDKLVFLGGDHSISFPLVKSFFESVQEKKGEPCLIVFDAHPDLMPVTDKKAPSHEEWLRGLIEAGFPAENILLVGVRNSDSKENYFIKENGIKKIDMGQFLVSIEETCDYIMEFSQGRDLYFSLDIDVVDPVFAPGTYYTEVGGLTSRQMIYLLQRMSKIKNLK